MNFYAVHAFVATGLAGRGPRQDDLALAMAWRTWMAKGRLIYQVFLIADRPIMIAHNNTNLTLKFIGNWLWSFEW